MTDELVIIICLSLGLLAGALWWWFLIRMMGLQREFVITLDASEGMGGVLSDACEGGCDG